jgi:hypothetical protein
VALGSMSRSLQGHASHVCTGEPPGLNEAQSESSKPASEGSEVSVSRSTSIVRPNLPALLSEYNNLKPTAELFQSYNATKKEVCPAQLAEVCIFAVLWWTHTQR